MWSIAGETTVSTLGRLVLIIWLFVVLIVNSSYTASLTSILTVQQLYSSVQGIESLKESEEPIGYQVGSFAEYYLTEELGIPKSRLVALGSPEAYATALQRGPKRKGVFLQLLMSFLTLKSSFQPSALSRLLVKNLQKAAGVL